MKLLEMKGKVNSLDYREAFGTKVLCWIGDAKCTPKPHKVLLDQSHLHIAAYAIRPMPTQVQFVVESSHKSIGFFKNSGLTTWSDIERIMPIEPAYYEENPLRELTAYNRSSLIKLPLADSREVENFELLCEISLDLPTKSSKTEFMELSIQLQQSTSRRTNNTQKAKRSNSKRKNAMIMSSNEMWDFFICHASEDKDDLVRPLADNLVQKGYKVWYDEHTLTVGDSLRQAIENGLTKSRYGVVILSEGFFSKRWPQAELDGLFAMEGDGKKRILPIWHRVTIETVSQHSPILAGRLGVNSGRGIDTVISELEKAFVVGSSTSS